MKSVRSAIAARLVSFAKAAPSHVDILNPVRARAVGKRGFGGRFEQLLGGLLQLLRFQEQIILVAWQILRLLFLWQFAIDERHQRGGDAMIELIDHQGEIFGDCRHMIDEAQQRCHVVEQLRIPGRALINPASCSPKSG